MGLFGKKMDQRMADANAQAADAMAAAQQQAGAMPGMDTPGMGGQDMAAMAAYAAKVNKIGQAGIEAPGVIHAIRATGTPDISGATMHEFDVSIRPEGGDMYEATVEDLIVEMEHRGVAMRERLLDRAVQLALHRQAGGPMMAERSTIKTLRWEMACLTLVPMAMEVPMAPDVQVARSAFS